MSGKNGKKSPQLSQPKKKKRRVKSNKEDKGHNTITVNKQLPGVSTATDLNTPKPFDFPTQTLNPNFTFGASNMAQFQNSQPMQPQPMQVAGMAPPGWYSPPGQVAGTGPGPSMPMGPPQVNYKPEWASELIDSVNQMRSELGKLSGIEKSLSSITLKLSNLESKVGTIENKVNNCKKACSFLSDKYETQKKDIEKVQSDLKTSKTEIAGLKMRCDTIETTVSPEINNLKARNFRGSYTISRPEI